MNRKFLRTTQGSPNSRGAIMIFALVILAVAAIGLAGSIYVMGALMEHTVATQNAVQRRLTLHNSRALAVQFVREKTLQGGITTALSSTTVFSGTNTLGTLSVTAPGSVWTGTATVAGANHFSPAGDTAVTVSGTTFYYSGYGASITATLSDGINSIPWTFEVRSRTPTLGYDLASYVATGTSASVTSANSVGTTTGPFLGSSLLNSTFPPDLSPSNFVTTATTGATAIAVGASSTTSEYIVSGGTVTLFLNGTNAARTYSITGNLTSLTFNYSGSYSVVPGFPLRVVCNGLSSTSAVNLNAGSTRPVYLVYNGSPAVTISHTSTPELSAVFLGTPVTIASGAIRGGLRTNGSIAVSGGTLSILRETNPGTLDTMALRRGWVETYRQ